MKKCTFSEISNAGGIKVGGWINFYCKIAERLLPGISGKINLSSVQEQSRRQHDVSGTRQPVQQAEGVPDYQEK